jgi:anaphase-promoting complex subunit 6
MQLVSAASGVLHVSSFLLLALLLSATGAAAVNGDTTSSNATALAAAGGSSSAPPTTTAGDITELYLCHMCLGRDMLRRRICPSYWPHCHAICPSYPPPAAVPTGTPRVSAAVLNDDDPCYVVKIYQNGTYDIVQYLDCKLARWCSLTCGGGDVVAVGDGGRAPGGAVPASTQGMLPPRVEERQVCNTQATARARAVPPRGA